MLASARLTIAVVGLLGVSSRTHAQVPAPIDSSLRVAVSARNQSDIQVALDSSASFPGVVFYRYAFAGPDAPAGLRRAAAVSIGNRFRVVRTEADIGSLGTLGGPLASPATFDNVEAWRELLAHTGLILASDKVLLDRAGIPDSMVRRLASRQSLGQVSAPGIRQDSTGSTVRLFVLGPTGVHEFEGRFDVRDRSLSVRRRLIARFVFGGV
jgi:hypothetical protein